MNLVSSDSLKGVAGGYTYLHHAVNVVRSCTEDQSRGEQSRGVATCMANTHILPMYGKHQHSAPRSDPLSTSLGHSKAVIRQIVYHMSHYMWTVNQIAL